MNQEVVEQFPSRQTYTSCITNSGLLPAPVDVGQAHDEDQTTPPIYFSNKKQLWPTWYILHSWLKTHTSFLLKIVPFPAVCSEGYAPSGTNSKRGNRICSAADWHRAWWILVGNAFHKMVTTTENSLVASHWAPWGWMSWSSRSDDDQNKQGDIQKMVLTSHAF